MPSGENPDGWDDSNTGDAIIGAGLSALALRTEGNIRAQKAAELQGNSTWSLASQHMFAGLDPSLPFGLALIQQLLQRFFPGTALPDWTRDSFLADPEGIMGEALDLIRQVPILGDLIEVLTGVEDGDETDLGTWVLSLLRGDSALPAVNLFGPAPQSLYDLIPLSAITNSSPNFLSNPVFETAGALQGLSDWHWDGAVTHNNTGGSAYTTADGYDHDLYSNPVKAVVGDELPLAMWAQWVSLVRTGAPVQLWAVGFSNGREVHTEVLDIRGSSTTSDWVLMFGSYTVPPPEEVSDGSTIDAVCMVLHVDHTATAGTVHFSDGAVNKLVKGGIVPQEWIQGLTDAFDAIDQFVQKFIDDIINGILGLVGVGNDPDAVKNAVHAQSNTIVGTSSQMVQMLAALGSGTPDADDFERFNILNLDTKWNQYSNGLITVATFNAHDAEAVALGDSEFVAYKNDVYALADNQIVTVVLGSAPTASPFWAPSEFGYNDLWLRMTDFVSWATRTGLRCRFGADRTVQVHWVSAGTSTLLVNGSSAPLSADLSVDLSIGAVLEFQAGLGGDPLHMTAKVNGIPVLDDVAVGTALYGPTYRRRGFGGLVNTGLLTGLGGPGRLKQWAAQG